MNEIVSYIADVGFPIALSFYLLIRIEMRLDSLTVSIEKLTRAILDIE